MRWAWIYNNNNNTSNNNNIIINMQVLCCNHKQHVPWECPCDLVRWVAEFQFYGRGDLVATTPDQAHQDLSITTTTTTHMHRYAQLQTALVCRDSKQPQQHVRLVAMTNLTLPNTSNPSIWFNSSYICEYTHAKRRQWWRHNIHSNAAQTMYH